MIICVAVDSKRDSKKLRRNNSKVDSIETGRIVIADLLP